MRTRTYLTFTMQSPRHIRLNFQTCMTMSRQRAAGSSTSLLVRVEYGFGGFSCQEVGVDLNHRHVLCGACREAMLYRRALLQLSRLRRAIPFFFRLADQSVIWGVVRMHLVISRISFSLCPHKSNSWNFHALVHLIHTCARTKNLHHHTTIAVKHDNQAILTSSYA